MPAKYIAETRDKRTTEILNEELFKKKEKYSHFDFEFMKEDKLNKKAVFS